MLKGLFKLSRPLTTLSGSIAVLLGGYVAGTGQWVNISLAVISTLLASAAANAWNDFQDIEIDKINQPKRPLPAGIVSPRAAWLFSVILSIAALILTIFINWTAFFIALGTILLLFYYSWKLKSTVLIGNMTIAGVSALSAVFGGIAAGNPAPSLWIAGVIVVGIFGREVLKTLADYEGDLRQHCRTVATVWGRRSARIVFFILLGATILMMLLPYLANVYQPVYLYIVVFGVYPVVFYILVRVTQDRTGAQLERLSQLMKYDFLVWFLAVLLGATG